MRFFSYDDLGDGYVEHETAEEARAAASAAIEWATDDDDGWDEDAVLGICWGEIRERSVIKNRRELTSEEKEEHPEWGFWAEVELEPEKETPAGETGQPG